MRLKTIIQALSLAAMYTPTPSLPAAEPLPLLLAGVEQGQADVALYLVSEKIDGVRAFWDGLVLRTRSGNIINAPRWFTENFPQRALDGELWVGRGLFVGCSIGCPASCAGCSPSSSSSRPATRRLRRSSTKFSSLGAKG